MGIEIDFDSKFDNEVLNEINKKYNIWDTNDNSVNNIIINLFEFRFFRKEIQIFKTLKIIDKDTNKLNIVKYNIFRKFIKKETIYWIRWDEIKRGISRLRQKDYDYKLILYLLPEYWFEANKITTNADYQFENNNELQIFALLLVFWKDFYDKFLLLWIWENNKIIFNNNNWEVCQNWVSLWFIKLDTMEYAFFNYLYKNKWTAQTHQQIFNAIKNENVEKWINNYLSDIKRRLPKEIKDIIKSSKGKYWLP